MATQAGRATTVPGIEQFAAQTERQGLPKKELRKLVGEFVGNVFYGTLLRQMQNSTIKGKYFHGGKGEDVFKGQLHMELARRMGRAPGDPIANRMYEAMTRGRNDEIEDRHPSGLNDSKKPSKGAE